MNSLPSCKSPSHDALERQLLLLQLLRIRVLDLELRHRFTELRFNLLPLPAFELKRSGWV